MRKIETSIEIAAPPEKVWAALVDFAEMDWNPMFASVRGQLAVGEQLTIVLRKPRLTIRPRITALEPGRRLQWRGNPGIPGLVDGDHVFELTAEGEKTRLRHGETFTGLLVPFVGLLLANAEKTFLAFNRALKARIEAP